MDQIEQNKVKMMSQKVWAVIGATPDQQKFGYRIYKKLKEHGYKVYGINPKYNEIDGDNLYQTIGQLPEKPQCVNMVVNPTITMATLEEIHQAGIEYVWFQPGTFDEAVIDRAENLGLKIVYYDCVLVELDNK